MCVVTREPARNTKMAAVASRPHASTGIGRPAAILVNNMVFYELSSYVCNRDEPFMAHSGKR